MAAWWWSWLLMVVGSTGVWIVGAKRRHGFVVLAVNETLWIIYAVTTSQWGFIPASLIYCTLYARNWVRWGYA